MNRLLRKEKEILKFTFALIISALLIITTWYVFSDYQVLPERSSKLHEKTLEIPIQEDGKTAYIDFFEHGKFDETMKFQIQAPVVDFIRSYHNEPYPHEKLKWVNLGEPIDMVMYYKDTGEFVVIELEGYDEINRTEHLKFLSRILIISALTITSIIVLKSSNTIKK